MSNKSRGAVRYPFALAGLIGLSLVMATAQPVAADKPLTLANCKALEADKADAIHNGIDVEMARGPEWAKANLGAERLREILRFIEIEEILKFRCVAVFKAAAIEKKRKDREAARRLGIKVPPLPGRNPHRTDQAG